LDEVEEVSFVGFVWVVPGLSCRGRVVTPTIQVGILRACAVCVLRCECVLVEGKKKKKKKKKNI